VVPFELWFHLTGQSTSSDRSPLYPAHGGVPVIVPSGILTWGQCAHYTDEILVFKEELHGCTARAQ